MTKDSLIRNGPALPEPDLTASNMPTMLASDYDRLHPSPVDEASMAKTRIDPILLFHGVEPSRRSIVSAPSDELIELQMARINMPPEMNVFDVSLSEIKDAFPYDRGSFKEGKHLREVANQAKHKLERLELSKSIEVVVINDPRLSPEPFVSLWGIGHISKGAELFEMICELNSFHKGKFYALYVPQGGESEAFLAMPTDRREAGEAFEDIVKSVDKKIKSSRAA